MAELSVPSSIGEASWKGRRVTAPGVHGASCVWPLGAEPPFAFCGKPVARPGASYCPQHERLAHSPPRRGPTLLRHSAVGTPRTPKRRSVGE
jgi:hypothetical protein